MSTKPDNFREDAMLESMLRSLADDEAAMQHLAVLPPELIPRVERVLLTRPPSPATERALARLHGEHPPPAALLRWLQEEGCALWSVMTPALRRFVIEAEQVREEISAAFRDWAEYLAGRIGDAHAGFGTPPPPNPSPRECIRARDRGGLPPTSLATRIGKRQTGTAPRPEPFAVTCYLAPLEYQPDGRITGMGTISVDQFKDEAPHLKNGFALLRFNQVESAAEVGGAPERLSPPVEFVLGDKAREEDDRLVFEIDVMAAGQGEGESVTIPPEAVRLLIFEGAPEV